MDFPCAFDALAEQVQAHNREREPDAGEDDGPPLAGRDVVAADEDHRAPLGGRYLHTDAEERKPGDGQDRVSHRDTELDDYRAECVRENVTNEQPPSGVSEGYRRFDVA